MRSDQTGSPGRPPSLQKRRTLSWPRRNVSTSIELACQPSPSRATRWKAPSLFPPIHSGGRGFWSGIGDIRTSAR